jgi:hypothetical protein
MNHSKNNLLQKLTDMIENKVDWYRIGYDACEHGEEGVSACSWGDKAEWTAKDVTIPADVPAFKVTA